MVVCISDKKQNYNNVTKLLVKPTKNIFNPISVSDYKAFALEQKDKALSEAKEKGLMKTAQENTKKSIKDIVSIIPNTDDYTIKVTFKE